MKGRKFTRANCSLGASIRYGSELTMCKIQNMSLRGMYLKTDNDIPLNTPLHVFVHQSNQHFLNVNATVVRKEVSGVGLEISSLNANSFAELRNIVAENSGDHEKLMQETYSMLKYIQ